MTQEQRCVYDTIVEAVYRDRGGLFFLNAFGGADKTFIWRAIAAWYRSKGEVVLTVASSGVAALLIPCGRTTHSRFSIPINVHEDSTCNISIGSELAQLIQKAKLIIWDEAPMMHNHYFEVFYRTLKDILKEYRRSNEQISFGGKIVVLGGDFRQILPVIQKGTRPEIVHATINSSYLWRHCKVMTLARNMRLALDNSFSSAKVNTKFAEWILKVGDGSADEVDDDVSKLEIPKKLLINGSGNHLHDIVSSTYPGFHEERHDPTYFQTRSILAPKNDIVDKINQYMSAQMTTCEKTYYSFDTPHSDLHEHDQVDNVHSTKYLNSISSPGLPDHVLQLKVGVPVILLRNIDQNVGLCNATRMIVTHLGKYVIETQVISGNHVGNKVYILRLSLTPSDVRIPFKFQ